MGGKSLDTTLNLGRICFFCESREWPWHFPENCAVLSVSVLSRSCRWQYLLPQCTKRQAHTRHFPRQFPEACESHTVPAVPAQSRIIAKSNSYLWFSWGRRDWVLTQAAQYATHSDLLLSMSRPVLCILHSQLSFICHPNAPMYIAGIWVVRMNFTLYANTLFDCYILGFSSGNFMCRLWGCFANITHHNSIRNQNSVSNK